MSTEPVQPDQLRVTVEMGDDFVPSAELADALDRLSAALGGSEAEVAGFGHVVEKGTGGLKQAEVGRSFAFDSLVMGKGPIPRVARPGQGLPIGF